MFGEFTLIRSKVRPSDMPGLRREFIGALRQEYTIRALTSNETFYTVPSLPNKILVSVDTMKVLLSFPLDLFVVAFFNASGLTPIHLSPNS